MDRLLFLIGRLPGTKKSERVRRALRETLGVHPYLSVELADDCRPENVRPLIDLAFLGLFDVSRSRDAGAFLDLGYALGRRKYCVLLGGDRATPVDDFAGDARVDYSSIRDLRRAVDGTVIDWIGGAIRKYTAEGRVFKNMDAHLMAPLAAGLLEEDVDDAFTAAGRHGFSEEQVGTTLEIFEKLGMARATREGWTVTELGRACVPRLVTAMTSGAGRAVE